MKEKLNREFLDLRKFENSINILELIKSITSNPNVEHDPFYIVDLEDICNKHVNWITQLPRVEPHYAIKCNTDPMLLKLLAYLGVGFDCASKNEIQKILDLGVSPDRIIFANPCKQASYIKYACKMGVDYMTFDNEHELYKIKEHHPNAKVVLRIITNDADAVCRFSMKFGADMETSLKLIETAVKLDLDLVGISFHVGSGQMSPKAFSESIYNARQLFDYARETHGLKMYLLDLGGGYPGSSDSGDLFSAIAMEINRALEEYFPCDYFAQLNGTEEKKLRVIAEPGRYFACSAFTLCVNIIAMRAMNQSAKQQEQDKENLAKESAPANVDTSKSNMYYINDGVYASFNCLFYDHADCFPILLKEREQDSVLYKSSIWGPTCDGLDVVVKECYLPELQEKEFMVFKDMGAYTLSGAVAFNGIPLARCIYIASTSWETIKGAFVESTEEELTCVSAFKEVNSNSSTCAAAATLGYTRAISSCQQQHEHECCSDSEEQSAHLLHETTSCAIESELTEKLNMEETALDQTSPITC